MTTRSYWEIKRVKSTYFGKPVVRFYVSHVLEYDEHRNSLLMRTYTTRYGAINYARKENEKANRTDDIIIKDGE